MAGDDTNISSRRFGGGGLEELVLLHSPIGDRMSIRCGERDLTLLEEEGMHVQNYITVTRGTRRVYGLG